MKKNFIPISIFILIILIIVTGFYQYESYKLKEKNENIEKYLNDYIKLDNEITQYKVLLDDISLITANSNELNSKLNDLKKEIDILKEEIDVINNKIKQIS